MTESVCSDVTDGPVIAVINKRIRALRKKLNRILQMEDSLTQGKTLNKEQEDTFRSKPMVLAAIDELEKLKQPISLALSEEISSAIKQQHLTTPPQSTNTTSESSDIGNTKDEVEDELKKEESGKQKQWAVQDLLNLLYFGSMFDVKSQNDFTSTLLTRTHERGCCLSYDYVTDDDDAVLLAERDLDMISMLGGLLLSRPVDSSLSHKNTLQRCVEHAMLWLNHSDQPIEPNSQLTYHGLRQKLEKIIASDYFTTPPQMRAPGDVAAYGGYQVPVQELAATVNLTDQMEVSPEHHGHREEERVVDVIGNGSNDQSGGVVAARNEGVEGEIFPQVHVQTEQQVVVQEEEVDQGQQEYVRRGPHQNQRGAGRGMNGGGRRGYPGGGSRGGRGGRGSFRAEGYPDGRNHYYDQVGGSSGSGPSSFPNNYEGGRNHYPRDNYYRGRGGRGGTSSGSGPGPNHYEGGQGGGYRAAN